MARKNPFDKVKYYVASPYGQHIYVTTSRKEWRKLVRYLTDTVDELPCNGCFTNLVSEKNGSHAFIMGWFNGEYSTLVHECVHATFAVLHAVGIECSAGDNEAFAYLHGDMWTSIAKMIGIKNQGINP